MSIVVDDHYAIFIHCDTTNIQIPIVTKVNSALHKFLEQMGKQYLVGSLEDCERLANDIIADEKGE